MLIYLVPLLNQISPVFPQEPCLCYYFFYLYTLILFCETKIFLTHQGAAEINFLWRVALPPFLTLASATLKISLSSDLQILGPPLWLFMVFSSPLTYKSLSAEFTSDSFPVPTAPKTSNLYTMGVLKIFIGSIISTMM